MSYEKVEAFQCSECGELYDHPSLAERCSNECRLYRLAKEVAELRVEQDDSEHLHWKPELSSMIDYLEDVRDEMWEEGR